MSAGRTPGAAGPRPWRRALPAVTALVALAAACGRGLPSLEPLGRGPLAEEEPVRAALRSDRRAPRAAADAGAAASASAEGGDAAPDAAPNAGAPRGDRERDAGAPEPDAGTADTGAVILAGEYLGPDYAIHRIDGFPDQRDDDPGARTRVELGQGSALRVVIVNSDSGEPLCDLEATAEGVEASIRAGQSCVLQGDVAYSTVRDGKAVFTGRRLVLDVMLDFEVRLEDGPHPGETEYHFAGTLP